MRKAPRGQHLFAARGSAGGSSHFVHSLWHLSRWQQSRAPYAWHTAGSDEQQISNPERCDEQEIAPGCDLQIRLNTGRHGWRILPSDLLFCSTQWILPWEDSRWPLRRSPEELKNLSVIFRIVFCGITANTLSRTAATGQRSVCRQSR